MKGVNVKAILLDIEGTCCPLSFVKEVLFPYAKDNVKSYFRGCLEGKSADPEAFAAAKKFASLLDEQSKLDGSGEYAAVDSSKFSESGDVEAFLTSAQSAVNYHTANDRKIDALKKLQAAIWQRAYDGGTLKAPVYEDVGTALEEWVGSGLKVYIYSSGSRPAQKAFFKYSTLGDLRPYLSAFFDTSAGFKREPESYVNIYQSLGLDHPRQILFVTDILAEAKAADAAGLVPVISLRDGNAEIEEEYPYQRVSDFTKIELNP